MALAMLILLYYNAEDIINLLQIDIWVNNIQIDPKTIMYNIHSLITPSIRE